MTNADEAFVEQHWRLALWVARRRAEQAGWRGDPQDVESDATWGLLQAAHTWHPDRGKPATWVRLRVENAITDGLRSRWGDTRKNGRATLTAVTDSLDRPVQNRPPATLGEVLPDPVDHITRASDRADLHKALQDLHPRERDTVTAWLNGEPLRAIGARHGVTESRASQINTTARRKLRRALAAHDNGPHLRLARWWGPSVRSRARRSPTVSAGLSRMRGCWAVSPCRQTDNGGAGARRHVLGRRLAVL